MNKNPLTKNEVINLLKKISIENLESEKVELLLAEGRILSSDIISSINLPPFNNSAVDGYAVHNDNLHNSMKLKCTQRVAAGDQTEIFLKTNEVARIFTGARMPNNCNTVIMQENVIIDGNYISMSKIPQLGENCRLIGEDVSKGDKIL
ncbi:MAG: molybdopterin molybdenumtransferase MoeA, partial [SAR202 cluster bacterium]|nr:molybdopterin molybdenumtransferase MoeA [SAR202 cluster bacterium]